jgi:undecaprenyl-diphosphatase
MQRIKKVFLFSLLSLVLLLAGWGYYVVISGNFATVEKGVLYRSAQPDKEDIERYAKLYTIHSILNLRGEDTDEWYKEEIQTSKALGIAHYDLSLSAYREPSEEDINTLINILKTAPKPLLIHCYGGADRTGLAVALYEYAIKKEMASQAKKNLSAFHGHLPFFNSNTLAMDKAFDRFVSAHKACD